MERNSDNENLEHFLRQNAEEFRIHPSSKVWEGISDSLAKRKRRFYFGLFALLISSSILGYTLLDLSFVKLAGTSAPVSTPSVPVKSSVLNKVSKSVSTNEATKLIVNGNHTELNSQTKAANNRIIASDPSAIEASNDIASQSFGNSFSNSLQNQRESWMADLLNNPSNSLLKGLSSYTNSFGFNNLASTPGLENNNLTEVNKAHKKPGKFSMMFYFAPSVSYRKLSENKSYIRSVAAAGGSINSFAALNDVNDAVTHKPNIGLEFGLTSKYAVSKNVKLRAGLQFNISRYNIKAFKNTPELAMIALNNGSSGVQSMGTMSTYRNFNGAQTDWLENFYFQLSTPIGAEVKIHGNDKVYIGAASTIQPTYVLGDQAYLITTDYKNYAQVPSLMRRWNVNTNLETFVGYSTGKLNWQVGPQVRYQLLSSFVDKYPVKENLFDFGLKVGISVNQNQ